MSDVIKFNLLGTDVFVKDNFLREKITGLDLSSLAVLGDSNAEGYGWWIYKANKTTKNDGYCAVLRELYPNATIDNYAVSGSTLSSNTSNYLLSQLNEMLASKKEYQHVIIQSGFNDISTLYNGTKNYIGITPLSRDLCMAINTYDTCVNAFCSYVTAIKKAIPTAKIHFLMRESQYTDSDVRQYSYYNLHDEIALACQIIGVDFIDLAYDGITSNNPEQKLLYYADDLHWNERAFREIVTPFIISHLIGDSNGSYNNTNKCIVVNSIGNSELFNNNTTITSGIQAFIDTMPELWSFNGQLILSSSRYNYSATIVKNSSSVNMFIRRNNSDSVCEIATQPYAYKKVTNNGFFNRNNNIYTSNNDGFNYAQNSNVNIPSSTYGIADTSISHTGNILKRYIDKSGFMNHSIINQSDGSLVNYWMNGGSFTESTNLANNDHLKSGFYFVNDISKVLSGPPAQTGYGLIVCAWHALALYFMLAFNSEGLWIGTQAGTWTKIG